MSIPGAEDTIDPSTFEQILEMDEDEAEREFSKSIVYDFFTQAEGTFVKMDTSLCVLRPASSDRLHLCTANYLAAKRRSLRRSASWATSSRAHLPPLA